MTASWVTPEEISPKPGDWSAGDYCVKPAVVRRVSHDQVFDLGNMKFSVLHLPGHSPGSLGLHDAQHGVLVTGDTLYQTDHGLIGRHQNKNLSFLIYYRRKVVLIC